MNARVVVIGAGLAGLTAAIRLAEAGRPVTLVAKGLGGLQLSQGTIDVLGYPADDSAGAGTRVERPLEALGNVPEAHPYRVIGADAVREAAAWLQRTLGDGALVGDIETNRLYPTAVGAMRPTALVPPSMAAGECVDGARFVIVGIRQLKDFHAELIAGNLARTPLPGDGSAGGGRVQARAAHIDLGARPGEMDANPVVYARALDVPGTRAKLVKALQRVVGTGEAVGLPAVLGLNDPAVHADIEQQLGQRVFEIPLQPPSVPGMRLNQALTQRAKNLRVRIVLGSLVTDFTTDGDRVTGVRVAEAGRVREIACDEVIHAPGGFESGALAMDSYGTITETVFGLPLAGLEVDSDPDNQPGGALVHGDYWGAPQLLFRVGVVVDDQFRVVDPATGVAVYANLRAAGGILAGATRWHEKSGEGIALGSAWRCAQAVENANQEVGA